MSLDVISSSQVILLQDVRLYSIIIFYQFIVVYSLPFQVCDIVNRVALKESDGGSATEKMAWINAGNIRDTITGNYISLTHSTLVISWNLKILSWRTGIRLSTFRDASSVSSLVRSYRISDHTFAEILWKGSIRRVYLICHVLATPCKGKGYRKINWISLCIAIFYRVLFYFISLSWYTWRCFSRLQSFTNIRAYWESLYLYFTR